LGLLKVGKVVATGEHIAGTSEDTAANLGIVIGVVDRGGQRAVGREVDGVPPFWPVDGQ
jgi:hypothetical protein